MSRLTISLPPAQQLVDGKLTGASDGATYPILDPATGQEIGVAPDSSAADVEGEEKCGEPCATGPAAEKLRRKASMTASALLPSMVSA